MSPTLFNDGQGFQDLVYQGGFAPQLEIDAANIGLQLVPLQNL